MTFTVASDSFKDGDYLPSDFILSSDSGIGWFCKITRSLSAAARAWPRQAHRRAGAQCPFL